MAYACWAEADEAGRPRDPSPGIAVADLTAFALQAACWGDPRAARLALLDAPPEGAMAAARRTLRTVGALDERTGRVTRRGQRMAGLGVHPRLARALLDGAAAVGSDAACETVALLGEEPPRAYGDDAAEAVRRARAAPREDPYGTRWAAEVRRLRSLLGARTEPPEGLTHELAVGTVVALAQPERVARAQSGSAYLMAGGTRARARRGQRAARGPVAGRRRRGPAGGRRLGPGADGGRDRRGDGAGRGGRAVRSARGGALGPGAGSAGRAR